MANGQGLEKIEGEDAESKESKQEQGISQQRDYAALPQRGAGGGNCEADEQCHLAVHYGRDGAGRGLCLPQRPAAGQDLKKKNRERRTYEII